MLLEQDEYNQKEDTRYKIQTGKLKRTDPLVEGFTALDEEDLQHNMEGFTTVIETADKNGYTQ